MSTQSAAYLGPYLHNALRSSASAELRKPVADALAALLGIAAPSGAELEAALDSLPVADARPELLARNARFAPAEFGLSETEFDILLLALRMRRDRALRRFCDAAKTVLDDATRTIGALLDRDPFEVQHFLSPGAGLCGCGLIDFDDEDPSTTTSARCSPSRAPRPVRCSATTPAGRPGARP